MKQSRPGGRVMLRRLLILVLVAACFSVVLANRIVTSAATAGFETRIASGLSNEAVLSFPLIAAPDVSRGRADAAHIDLYMQRAIHAAFADAGLAFAPFSRQFVRLAEASDTGQVELLTTEPGFLAAWGVGLAPDVAPTADSCLVGRTLAASLGDPLPQWLHFGDRRCPLAGVFDATGRAPFWTLDRAVLRLAPPGRAMTGETFVWSGFLHSDGLSFGAERLREGLTPWIDPDMVEIWSSRDQAARAAEILTIYRFVSGTISGIALGISAFAIATTFTFSVSGQLRDIAIRRALGATQWRIMIGVQSEVAGLVGAGLGLGLVAGPYLGHLLLQHMAGAGVPGLSSEGSLAPQYIAGLGLLFLLTGLIAGLIPAITAARVDPAIILRGS
ncbi:ABC transporter permease [Pseudogemmobacter humi]|uniref:FtsX-like permease family protein n=1 Tax=Pseudogemmobacter humi TaxID=2483812 RepID=A0A3P5WSV0_9RHOB|nr:ABC transporter permease [Pseudogemmobacter humi]VDC24695.1 FtsX-like permease family protein [Pseudogemmobacter humi]